MMGALDFEIERLLEFQHFGQYLCRLSDASLPIR